MQQQPNTQQTTTTDDRLERFGNESPVVVVLNTHANDVLRAENLFAGAIY